MRQTTSILTAFGTALALIACGSDGSTDPGGNGGGGGDDGGDDSEVIVNMQNTAFVAPDGGNSVTVPVGTTVTWVNRDAVQHTATSSDEPSGGEPIQTGLMGNGDRRSFTPMVEGTWTYFCEVHPGIMVGATITATADDSGSNTSSDDPPSGDDGPSGPGY